MPTADAQLHAAANAAATSCDHHGGIHFELGIDPEARLLLTLHKLHHVGIADLLAWYDECQQCSGNQRPSCPREATAAFIASRICISIEPCSNPVLVFLSV